MKRKVIIIHTGIGIPRGRAYLFLESLCLKNIIPVFVSDSIVKELGKTLLMKIRECRFRRWLLPCLHHLLEVNFFFKMIIDFIAIPFIITFENPSFIILTIPGTTSLLPTWLACKMLSKKLVIDIRDEVEESHSKKLRFIAPIIKKIFNLIYSSADALFVVSPLLLDKYKVLNSKVFLITNYVDTSSFKPITHEEKVSIRKSLNFSVDDFVLIYSGKLGYPYRIDTLLKAIKILKDRGLKNIKLLIIGKPEGTVDEKFDYKTISFLLNKLNICDLVITLPFMPQEKLVKYASIANIGIIPLDKDPLWKYVIPIKFMEYSALGLPSIVSTYPDSVLAKIINKYKVGLICNLCPKDLANTIQYLFDQRNLLKSFSENARILAEKEFDKSKILQDFSRIIDILL
ncbi:MAG: glycosyltransferase [Desulfurococcaceae archaeon]